MNYQLRRPDGVLVLAVLDVALGTIYLLIGALSLLLPNGNVYGVVILETQFLGLAALNLASGIGFLLGRGWAWTLGMAGTIIVIIGNIVEIWLFTAFVLFSGPIIAFSVFVLYYLSRPHVKGIFSGESERRRSRASI